jgi:hypothetical protein
MDLLISIYNDILCAIKAMAATAILVRCSCLVSRVFCQVFAFQFTQMPFLFNDESCYNYTEDILNAYNSIKGSRTSTANSSLHMHRQ